MIPCAYEREHVWTNMRKRAPCASTYMCMHMCASVRYNSRAWRRRAKQNSIVKEIPCLLPDLASSWLAFSSSRHEYGLHMAHPVRNDDSRLFASSKTEMLKRISFLRGRNMSAGFSLENPKATFSSRTRKRSRRRSAWHYYEGNITSLQMQNYKYFIIQFHCTTNRRTKFTRRNRAFTTKICDSSGSPRFHVSILISWNISLLRDTR